MSENKLVRIRTKMEINNKWYLQTRENDPYFGRIGLLVDVNTVLFSGVDTPVILPKELVAPLPKTGEECTVILHTSSIPTEVKAKFVNIADTPLGIPQAYIVQLEDGSYFGTASIRFDESVKAPNIIKLEEENERLKERLRKVRKELHGIRQYADASIMRTKLDSIVSDITADFNLLL